MNLSHSELHFPHLFGGDCSPQMSLSYKLKLVIAGFVSHLEDQHDALKK